MPEFVGTLRHLLTLEQPTETTGDAVVSATVVTRQWGEVRGLGGAPLGEHQITMRFNAAIRPGHRIRYGDRTFQVMSVGDPDGRRRQLTVMAMEVTASPHFTGLQG